MGEFLGKIADEQDKFVALKTNVPSSQQEADLELSLPVAGPRCDIMGVRVISKHAEKS